VPTTLTVDCDGVGMNEQRMLDELLALLEGAGVKIRREPLGGAGGGVCTVRGENLFFVDTDAGLTDTATQGAEAVSRLLDTEAVYMRPEVRQFIEKHAGRA
jgi:hypothetical protein